MGLAETNRKIQSRTGEEKMNIIADWKKTERAFKVPKKVRAKWDAMTECNDHQGRMKEEILFIAQAMKKVGSPFAEMAQELYERESGLCEKRDKAGGLNYMECQLGRGYYNMALALVATETSAKVAKEFSDGDAK